MGEASVNESWWDQRSTTIPHSLQFVSHQAGFCSTKISSLRGCRVAHPHFIKLGCSSSQIGSNWVISPKDRGDQNKHLLKPPRLRISASVFFLNGFRLPPYHQENPKNRPTEMGGIWANKIDHRLLGSWSKWSQEFPKPYPRCSMQGIFTYISAWMWPFLNCRQIIHTWSIRVLIP